jgi:hypothetical protein
MRNFTYLLILLLIPYINRAQEPATQKIKEESQNLSDQLINRYNKIRESRSLPLIRHDSLLDRIAEEIQSHSNEYKNPLLGSFSEEAIRKLFYEQGVIDYKYEIIEAKDKDTISVFKSFLIKDRSNNIRCGYSRIKEINVIIKTHCFLEFAMVTGFVHPRNIKHPSCNQPLADSIFYILKEVIPGKYRFYFSDQIPANPLPEKSVALTELSKIENIDSKLFGKNHPDFDLVLRSKQPNRFAIIVNEKKEIIAFLK